MTASAKHVVVDGSNIATEGRTIPSLDQLESAVAEIRKDLSDTEVTVVVDATFAHRIDPSESARFEASVLRGEYVSPPAGAIGRGDAFLLRIAEKVNATVLSNDSFQEFHGEHPWLFETGRLLGATPVPGIGWIFVPRTPVRGPKSRVAVREATKAKSRVVQAVAVATAEATGEESAKPGAAKRSSRRRSAEPERELSSVPDAPRSRPEAVNAPIPFITFIAEHPLGASVDGLVDSFTSHGAVIIVGDVRCYVPLSGLATPAPRSARDMLKKGSHQEFLVTALDPARRGIELALPGVGVVRGVPSEETVAAEVEMTRPSRRRRGAAETVVAVVETPPTPLTRRGRKAVAKAASTDVSTPTEPAKKVAAKKAAGRVAAAPSKAATSQRKATPKQQPAAETTKAPTKRAGSAARVAPMKKAAPKKVPATKQATKRTSAQQTPATTASAVEKRAATASRGTRLSPPAGPQAKKAAPTRRSGASSAKVVSSPETPVSRAETRASEIADGPRRSGRSRK